MSAKYYDASCGIIHLNEVKTLNLSKLTERVAFEIQMATFLIPAEDVALK